MKFCAEAEQVLINVFGCRANVHLVAMATIFKMAAFVFIHRGDRPNEDSGDGEDVEEQE